MSDCFIELEVTPQDIVQQALASGMDAIAITDHNTAQWVDLVKGAAEHTELTVFPGVEITVQPGIHVIALFPEDRTSEHVTDLLSELGLKSDDRGKPESLVTKYGVQEVVSIIHNSYNALAILAHIDDVKGACKVLSGQMLIQLWNAAMFSAVEIIGDTLPEEITRSPFEYPTSLLLVFG